jgi:hypothetical protein
VHLVIVEPCRKIEDTMHVHVVTRNGARTRMDVYKSCTPREIKMYNKHTHIFNLETC